MAFLVLPSYRGLGTSRAALDAAASGYSTEASQFFSRITDPGTTRKDAYAAIIDSLVSNGIWSKLDCLWITAADIAGNAVVNLKSSSFTLTEVNSPGFTADQGYQASGTTQYLDTNFNSTTASSPNYIQDSAHFSVWNRLTATDTLAIMGSKGDGSAGESQIYPKYTADGNFYGRVNDGAAGAFGSGHANASGHFLANRSSSSALQGYRNGSAIGSGVTQSSSPPLNLNFWILRVLSQNASTAYQVAVASIGGSLTSTEAGNLYTALNTNKWW
jgi:hypothetical protein